MIYINDQPAEGPEREIGDDQAPLFFAVSPRKFLILSLCTLGLYEMYWFYRNWQLVKQREGSDIWPFWRAVFGYFFCYALLSRIRDAARDAGAGDLPAGPLSAGWIIISMLWKLPEPYWLVCYAAIACLLPAQIAVCRINEALAPEHRRNDRLSGWNIAAIALGGGMLLLAVYGALFMKV
ncbi:hypothetical protein BI347_13020 [Chromobacterium sphagni]|uniref:DUF4234 domain-containing protein n=1 Tax=Chromobacterium sphagni TaxID=1903179 RepID=A0A1S1X4C3_9NEIS|nr:hypothetical protein [Chromobacterium sphagni]OHX14322.1 hypothetical protein BI347_13020 [Chromobacterium sphagni]